MSSRLVYPLPSSHTSNRQPCTVRLVSQSEAMGVPLRFCAPEDGREGARDAPR